MVQTITSITKLLLVIVQTTDTIENRRANYVEQIANGILSYRLNSLVLAGNAPFEGVGSSHGLTFNQADVSQVIAQMQPDKWAESLSALVLEIRRMVEFGITVDDALWATLNQFAKLTLVESTGNSRLGAGPAD